MFRIRMKSAALVAALACAAVLVQSGRASAQSGRPPGLKGYALVQWMDEHRTRSSPSARGPQPWAHAAPRSYAYPQPLVYAQPYYQYLPSSTFAPPAAPTAVWGAPVVWPCGRP